MSALSSAASPSLSFILTLTAPSLPELHRRQVRFFFFTPSLVGSSFSRCARHSCFQPPPWDVLASTSEKSGSVMMKKFVTIVLRGLVTLSKESPIWAKEHNRPLKKDIRKKRRAAKRAKAMGRHSSVRAVGIPPLVHHVDRCCLRRYCLGV